jgi:Outer membrane protein beta-barrel domain
MRNVSLIFNKNSYCCMKKIVFIVVLFFSISLTYAQFNFGIKAGYSSSLGIDNLKSGSLGGYNVNSANAELSNDFHAGAFARISLLGFYFQPELLYAMGKKDYKIGYKDASSSPDKIFEKSVTLSTIDVPLLIGYKLLDLKVVNARVYAGPKLRFNAGSQLTNMAISGALSPTQMEVQAKAAQLGLEAGFGVDVLMFTLDARYNLIGDLYTTKINTSTLDNAPISTFVISVGYKLL